MMAEVSIFYGSVFGAAERLAERAEEALKAGGHKAKIVDDPSVDDVLNAKALLFISSTTGQGDIPDNLVPLIISLESQFPMLTGKPYGVIAMGDSSYGDTFCGAGRKIDALLGELQASPVVDRLDVDAIVDYDAEVPALPWLEHFGAALK